MKIIHKLHQYSVEKNISENTGFMICNGRGSYFSQGINSRYSGMFCYIDGEMYRILDSVSNRDAAKNPIRKITNNLSGVDVSFRSHEQAFFMPHGFDVLACSMKKEQPVNIKFDVRKSYDLRKWGKDYRIYEEGDYIIIEFTKKTDKREDDSHGKTEYKLYIAICGDNIRYKLANKWVSKQYAFDMNRESGPSEWYVYEGLHILAENIIISAAKDKKDAVKNAGYVKKNLEALKKKEKKRIEDSFVKIAGNKELSFAYNLASQSMKDLCIGLSESGKSMQSNKEPGIFAGQPWFFQFWTRDEAISLKSLMLLKEYRFCSDVLMRELKAVGSNGRIPNRFPATDIETADGTGWMFRRCADLRDILDNEKKKRLKKKYFSSFFSGWTDRKIIEASLPEFHFCRS